MQASAIDRATRFARFSLISTPRGLSRASAARKLAAVRAFVHISAAKAFSKSDPAGLVAARQARSHACRCISLSPR